MIHNLSKLPALTVTLSLCLFTLSADAAPRLQYRVTELAPLPGGVFSGLPRAISNQGVVVGAARNEYGVERPFVYRNGVSTELKVGDGEGTALDINDLGEIIVETRVISAYQNFLVKPSGSIPLKLDSGEDVFPLGLNNLGEVVGFAFDGLRFHAVSWSNGMVRPLGPLDGSASIARSVNDSGLAAGEVYTSATTGQPPVASAALFWNGRTMLISGFPEGESSFAQALNDRGEVVVNTSRGCFLFTGGSLVSLDALPGDSASYGYAINNRGDVVGASKNTSGVGRAFLYMDGDIHCLDDLLKPNSDWQILAAFAINDNREIVGVGDHNGQHGVLLTPNKPAKHAKTPKPR